MNPMRKRLGQPLLLLAMMSSLYLAEIFTTRPGIRLIWLGLYTCLIVLVAYSLILEARAPYHTLLWLSVLIFLPVFGYILYLYSGQLYLKGLLFRTKRERNREFLRHLSARAPSDKGALAALPPAQRCFASLIESLSYTSVNFSSRTSILVNGHETYRAIKQHLRAARQYIHLEYYIFRSDHIGGEILDILKEKVQQGVEVRFIYDAIGSFALSRRVRQELTKAGVQIHAFSPISNGFFNLKFNFRNHRKIIVIDGKIGFTGGLNVGDEYLGKDKNIGFWRDTHLMIEGEALRTLHAVFILDWSYVSGEELTADRYLNISSAAGDGGLQISASGPDTKLGLMSDLYYALMSCAEESIWIATPYFIPNEAIRTVLKMAAHKGIDVRLLVPAISDSWLTQYATASYFPELLAAGIKIFRYKKGFLHQKIVIIDGTLASIGTANIDLRSLQLNFEVNAFLFHSSSVHDLVQQYEDDIRQAECITDEIHHMQGRWARTKEAFARLFSPIL